MMNLKVLFAVLVYYGLVSLAFFMSDGLFISSGASTTIDLNSTNTSVSLLSTPLDFIGFVGFGVGLPTDTPTWFSIPFIAFQTILTLFVVGFLIASLLELIP